MRDDWSVSDYAHKERPPIDAVSAWLAEHHRAAVEHVATVRGGYWSSAWSYRCDGRDLILRLGDSSHGYQIDRAAEAFRMSGVPVPEVVHIGTALGKAAAISVRHSGSFVEEADPSSGAQVADALIGLLLAMRRVPAQHVEWHQPASLLGWRDWLAQGLPVPAALEPSWHAACATHPEVRTTWQQTVEALGRWLPQCAERRDLIHRDLLHQNVLVEGGRAAGVFSWKHSLFGDFLYDVAACTLWSDWHHGVAAADVWSAVQEAMPAADLIDAAERHRMYQLHIGLEHLYWNVSIANDADLLRLTRIMQPLLTT